MELLEQLVIQAITTIKKVPMARWGTQESKDILGTQERKDMLVVLVLQETLVHKE